MDRAPCARHWYLTAPAEQRHDPAGRFRDLFATTILVFLMSWVAGEFFYSGDETMRSVAIHVFGVGK